MPEDLKHYTVPNDSNRIIYHQRITFVGCLSTPTLVETKTRQLHMNAEGNMQSSTLQNPLNPETAFRIKGRKSIADMLPDFNYPIVGNGSVITEYQYEHNHHSHSQFSHKYLEQIEQQEYWTIIIANEAYGRTENVHLALNKNIELITTFLT